MNRILFLGMDLSGKSHTSLNVANFLGRDIRSNLLTSDRIIYNEIVNNMRTKTLTDREKLYLFYKIYRHDLEAFKSSKENQSIPLIQDNFGIVRNIAYFYYKGYDVDCLIQILKAYPQSENCFYLRCSKEERIRRLEERVKSKTEGIYEKLLRENPDAFYELDRIAYDLYANYFDCCIYDNTNVTEEESLEHILERIK